MGLQSLWYEISKRFYRLLEKGIYISLGVIAFLVVLLSLFIINCGYRLFIGLQNNFKVETAVQCFTGEGFPIGIFLFALFSALFTIATVFYLVEKEQS